MTLTMDLTPDEAARLQTEADRAGLSLADYVRRRLLGDASKITTGDTARLSAVDAAMGALADSGISSQDFMNEKQTDPYLPR